MQEYFILRKQYIEVTGPHHLSSARDKWLLFLVNEISFKIFNWEQWKKHRSKNQEKILSFSEGYDKNLSLFLYHGTQMPYSL